jgi:hypothetical protein
VSKSSRRASRSGSRPVGGARPTDPAAPSPSEATAQSAGAATTRPSVRPTRPTGSRAGRRERSRAFAEKSFFERYRTLIIGAVVVAVVAVLGAFAFTSSSAAAYTCSSEFAPGTTPAPASEDAGEPGYVQPDMGNRHVALGSAAAYTYCPPATGPHYNVQNRGPIRPGLYGPNETVIPQGWVHNLEHGALVVLYRGREGDPGLTPEIQAELEAWSAAMPASPVCGYPASQYLVVARFDDMATPFAALVWGRMLPLTEWNPSAVEAFWNTSGEQALTMPERFGCPLPSESPAGSPDAASPEPS